MTPPTSPIRSAVLAALIGCALGGRALAQVESETSLLAVPTARVSPAGTPAFTLSASTAGAGGGGAMRVPVAVVLALGSGFEIGAKLDNTGPPAGAADAATLRGSVKWLVRSGTSRWRVAVAGLGARSLGEENAATRLGAGARATREGFRAAWSGAVDYWAGGLVDLGFGLERSAAGNTVLALEVRAGSARPSLGMVSVRKTLVGGISGWAGLGIERRGSRTAALMVLAVSIAPREAYFVPGLPSGPTRRGRGPPVREAPSEVPDLATAIARETERLARMQAREEFLRAQSVVPLPVPAELERAEVGVAMWSWASDSAAMPSSLELAALAGHITALQCGVTVRVGSGASGELRGRQVNAVRRALAILGVDPLRIEVRSDSATADRILLERSGAVDRACAVPQR